MVLVDIFVPSVDKEYDFQLSETAEISTVIEEISEMIGQKERTEIVGDINRLQLCHKERQCILDRNRTLAQCGVVTGSRLILV